VRQDLDAELGQEGLAEVAEPDPRRGLPSARPFQDVAGVVGPVLLHPGQVGVAGPRSGQALGGVGVAEGRHPLGELLLPLRVVDGEGDGAPEGAPVAEAAQDFHPVRLELLAAAPPVPVASPGQLVGEGLVRDRDARREALQDRYQGLAVGLTCSEQSKHGPIIGVRPDPTREGATGRERR
jgi:hypothetical protein